MVYRHGRFEVIGAYFGETDADMFAHGVSVRAAAYRPGPPGIPGRMAIRRAEDSREHLSTNRSATCRSEARTVAEMLIGVRLRVITMGWPAGSGGALQCSSGSDSV